MQIELLLGPLDGMKGDREKFRFTNGVIVIKRILRMETGAAIGEKEERYVPTDRIGFYKWLPPELAV